MVWKYANIFFKLDFESLASCFCVLFQAVYNIELIWRWTNKKGKNTDEIQKY